MKPNTSEHLKKPYTKPEVVQYGTIEALTSGGTGAKSDGGALSLAS